MGNTLARRKMIRPTRGDSAFARRMYLANLPSSTSEVEVSKLFCEAGILVARLERLCPGAFYVWVPENSCRYAISAINGKEVEGRTIKCEFGLSSSHYSKADFLPTLHEGRRVTTSGQRSTKFSSRPPKGGAKY